MSEIEELRNQLATIILMTQQQQKQHTLEIAKFQNTWTLMTTITVKQPDTYDGHKVSVELWIFQMKQYFLATGTQNQERTVYLVTNLLRGEAATWWRHHHE